eukprot:11792452-Alexandrium_andersonii.AAC.1
MLRPGKGKGEGGKPGSPATPGGPASAGGAKVQRGRAQVLRVPPQGQGSEPAERRVDLDAARSRAEP